MKHEERVSKLHVNSPTWSLISDLSCCKEETQSVFVFGWRLICCSRGPWASRHRGLKVETSKVASVHLHLPLRPQSRQMKLCFTGAPVSLCWSKLHLFFCFTQTYVMILFFFFSFAHCQTNSRNFHLGISKEVFLSSTSGFQHTCWHQ